MSKGNGYVPIDKALVQELNNLGRPFTRLEAMFSYSVDQDNKITGSINGYASLWGWSRNKTRRFLTEIRTVNGHLQDSRRTPNGQAVHFIDASLRVSKDTRRTVCGQLRDSERHTTIDPNPKPNPKPKKKDLKPLVVLPQIPYEEIIEYLNQKAGKTYKHSNSKTRSLIRARWNDGFKDLDSYKHVIDVKCSAWLNTEREQYLRPETLFSAKKFEGYLNERKNPLQGKVSNKTLQTIKNLKEWVDEKL